MFHINANLVRAARAATINFGKVSHFAKVLRYKSDFHYLLFIFHFLSVGVVSISKSSVELLVSLKTVLPLF